MSEKNMRNNFQSSFYERINMLTFRHRAQNTRAVFSSPLWWDLFFLLLLTLFYALLLTVIKPVDGINDDWGMYSTLSGAYTGTPDAHVMFFLYPLAWLLAKLYTLCSFIPWYGLFQHGVQIACLFAVYRRFLRLRRRHNPKASFLAPALSAFLFLFSLWTLM